jgi:hypothetical protein
MGFACVLFPSKNFPSKQITDSNSVISGHRRAAGRHQAHIFLSWFDNKYAFDALFKILRSTSAFDAILIDLQICDVQCVAVLALTAQPFDHLPY